MFKALFASVFLVAFADAQPSRVFKAGGAQWHWTGVPGAIASAEEVIEVSMALKPRDQAALDKYFLDIASPSSDNYGKFLTFEEANELTRNDAGARIVADFLYDACGATDAQLSPSRDFLDATLTLHNASRCLQADFRTYTSMFGESITRTLSYRLPAAVAQHVQVIHPVGNFPDLDAGRRVMRAGEGDATNVTTPTLLFQYYGSDASPVTQNVTQGVFEQGQSFVPSDLKAFQELYKVADTPVTKIIGKANDPGSCTVNPGPCIEGEMDTQYITAMAPKAALTYYAYSRQENYLDYVKAVADDATPPLVHSISYGWNEHYEDPDSMAAFNTAAQKLALRGLSFLASTGDDGVANQRAREDDGFCGFFPSFPATSPFVLAVGATRGPESQLSEETCMAKNGGLITSGGGFSENSPRPSWQDKVVTQFLQTSKDLPQLSHFTSTGRAYPDVSLLGLNYQVCVADQCERPYQVSGTSASCPAMAGLVTKINDARMAANKPPLGALGPAFYSVSETSPAAFKDITFGDNKCTAMCERPECTFERLTCCDEGFAAQAGWDAVTGLGSVHYPALLQALLAL